MPCHLDELFLAIANCKTPILVHETDVTREQPFFAVPFFQVILRRVQVSFHDLGAIRADFTEAFLTDRLDLAIGEILGVKDANIRARPWHADVAGLAFPEEIVASEAGACFSKTVSFGDGCAGFALKCLPHVIMQWSSTRNA